MPETQPFALNLPNGHGSIAFASPSEFQEWLTKERDYWESLKSAGQQPQLKLYMSCLATVTAQFSTDIALLQQHWPTIQHAFEQEYNYLHWRHSPRGAFIEALRTQQLTGDDAATMAAAAAAFFLNRPVQGLERPSVFMGVRRAMDYNAGVHAEMAIAAEAFDALHTEIRSWFTEHRDLLVNAVRDAARARTEIAEFQTTSLAKWDADLSERGRMIAASQGEMSRRLLEVEAETNGKIDLAAEYAAQETTKAKEQIEAFKRGVEAQLALQAPVQYWKDKAADHRWWARVFGWSFAGSVLACGAGLSLLILWFLPEETDWSKVPVGRIALTGVVATLSIWLVKTLARLFLSNQHLATDAAERVVMTQTYLSLMKEGEGFKDEDKAIMLQSLFRRTTTGIVKDDANPPVLFAELVHRGKDGG